MPFELPQPNSVYQNSTKYGLAAYIWTNNIGRAHKLASLVKSGIIAINSGGNLDPAVPVGGYKSSGYGRELGTYQLDDYLNGLKEKK